MSCAPNPHFATCRTTEAHRALDDAAWGCIDKGLNAPALVLFSSHFSVGVFSFGDEIIDDAPAPRIPLRRTTSLSGKTDGGDMQRKHGSLFRPTKAAAWEGSFGPPPCPFTAFIQPDRNLRLFVSSTKNQPRAASDTLFSQSPETV
jgi:hypothetical protein